ncbi:SIMPL domain-containing protein [Halomonas cibimaris]|uniref:SIMPL domain-containing protein n=1 Tax=Halomonas cibimaris TaxID=657012 RepID=A0ABP7L8U9_9GAMM
MRIVPALILGAAGIIAATFIGSGLTDLGTGDRYVTVKGLAERDVTADTALWPLRFVATGDTLENAQANARESQRAVMAFLDRQQIDTDAVELQKLSVNDTSADPYQSSDGGPTFIINQTLTVRSQNIDRVRRAAQAIGELVDAGVVLSSDYGDSGPSYLFSRLNDIKPEMIANATAAARQSAEQFAEDANAEVGKLRRANQGVFQIRARDHAAGVSQTQQAEKTVRVVTTVDYYLK